MGWKARWGKAVSVAAIFLAFGPPIGSVVVFAALLASKPGSIFAPSSAEEFLDMALGTLSMVFPMSYFIGGIPAGLSGLICGAVSPRIRSLRAWLTLTAVVGFLVSATLVALVLMTAKPWPDAIALVGAAGGLAGLACGWFTRGLRSAGSISD